MKKNISVSILNVNNTENLLNDIACYSKRINQINTNAFELMIHFDIMDKKFVPNYGVDLSYIKIVKKLGLYADVHLMVEKPIEDGYIDEAIKLGADRISIHYEIDDFDKTLEYLNGLNINVGIVIKPDTKVEEIEKYKGKFSNLLIMSVEPGFGGQKYIETTNDKLKIARKIFNDTSIQIDGGVNLETIIKPLEIGVDSFVIGSCLINSKNVYEKLIEFNILKDIVLESRTENLEFSKRVLQIVKNGYASEDILLGVRTPNMRNIAKKWNKYVSLNIINTFFTSNIHEFRQFAIFSLTYILNNNNIEEIYKFVNKNINYINNWDLTDIVGPNILAKYLITLNDKNSKREILKYMSSNKLWVKRLGIVILLEYVRKEKVEFVLECLSNVLYEEYHLYQKATGWVLREAYKKDSNRIYNYLFENNKIKRLPRILLSYACEKMTKEQKEKIRSVN